MTFFSVFSVNAYIPEIFLVFSILVQLVYGCLINTRGKSNIFLILREISSQNFITIVFLMLLYCVFFYSDHLSTVHFYSEEIYKNKFLVCFIAYILLFFVKFSIKLQKIGMYEYYLITLIALLALLLIIDTDSLLMFYLLIEMQSLCFYILASINRNNIFSVESGLKYFISGAFMSSFFLLGAILIYGVLGTFNINEINSLLIFGMFNNFEINFLVLLGSFLITCVLLFKISSFPFHFWMPDVYEGAALSSTIIFSILPKFSLVYFIIKWFLGLGQFFVFFQDVLVFFGLASSIIGTLYAIIQVKTKRMLLYSSIVQIGFIVAGLGVNTDSSIISVFFFTIIYIITSFLIWGYLMFVYNSNEHINQINKKGIGSLYIANFSNLINYTGIWTLVLSIMLFSISGIPPFVGFTSKLLILDSLIDNYILVSIFLITISSVSVYYYIRVLKLAFFEPTIPSIPSALSYKNKIISVKFDDLIVYDIFLLLIFFTIYLFFYPNIILLIIQF